MRKSNDLKGVQNRTNGRGILYQQTEEREANKWTSSKVLTKTNQENKECKSLILRMIGRASTGRTWRPKRWPDRKSTLRVTYFIIHGVLILCSSCSYYQTSLQKHHINQVCNSCALSNYFPGQLFNEQAKIGHLIKILASPIVRSICTILASYNTLLQRSHSLNDMQNSPSRFRPPTSCFPTRFTHVPCPACVCWAPAANFVRLAGDASLHLFASWMTSTSTWVIPALCSSPRTSTTLDLVSVRSVDFTSGDSITVGNSWKLHPAWCRVPKLLLVADRPTECTGFGWYPIPHNVVHRQWTARGHDPEVPTIFVVSSRRRIWHNGPTVRVLQLLFT